MAGLENVVKIATRWVGRQFHPGQVAQCAYWVRDVFGEAHVFVGNAAHPSDAVLVPGGPFGPGYADSFAGNDVGRKILDLGSLEGGDILMFRNTFGNFPAGTITHVGIYLGHSQVADRPTASMPVRQRSLDSWSPVFVEARRIGQP